MMSLPNNRDALRNLLRSSLSDVLMDLDVDNNRIKDIGVRTFDPSLQQSSANHGSTLTGAFAYPFLPSSHNDTLLAQSFGLSLRSPVPLFNSGTSGLRTDELMLAAAASCEPSKVLELAKASLIQQNINEERKRLLLQQTYLSLIKNISSHETQSMSIPQDSVALKHASAMGSVAQTINGQRAIEALGASLRSKTDPYIDVAEMKDLYPEDTALRRSRGGVSEQFPEKLHRMLIEMEGKGLSDVVSFFPHGRAFVVHDMNRFVSEVMPQYFKQSKWNSFSRQLNLYGFIRINSGPDAGGYYHELFLKGRPNLSFHMRRVGVPQGEDRRKLRSKKPDVEHDFYSMKRVTTDGYGPFL